ncbi:AI-2E family transporter [Clostridium sp. MSJ-11]|uniref:AI-2E family transporter n=1 Tax=Clostridium mobile TaxID=2841512 RepID=A0ABS6EH00_9CLOT|nr:AI-2E family transporter [Clostridium mobile]MBU5484485.1 AI-2E family transporter [Clostridium mobile]
MYIDKKTARHIIFIGCSVVLFYLAVSNFPVVMKIFQTLFTYISPIFLGLCIGYTLNIPMRSIEKGLYKLSNTKGKTSEKTAKLIRPISIILTLISFIAVILLVMFIVIPEIGRTIASINKMMPSFIERIQIWSEGLNLNIPILAQQAEEFGISFENINRRLLTLAQNLSLSIIDSFMSIIGITFKSLLQFFLGLVFAFYMLMNKETLINQIKRVLKAFLPEGLSHRIIKVSSITNNAFINFFTGQFIEALILGGMFWVGMTIFRFPYATIVSVLIAFTALIPIFGAFIGCVVGAFLILVSNPTQAFWFIIFFLIIQQIEGNIIYPKVVGASVGLPAIWVFTAVTIGGSMMGVLGMLTFIPIASVLYTLLRESVNTRLKNKVIEKTED